MTGVGAPVIGSEAALRLREGDDLADVGLADEDGEQAVDARADAGVRRRAVLERLQHVAELALRLLRAMPSIAKTFSCTSRWWMRMLPLNSSQPLQTRS